MGVQPKNTSGMQCEKLELQNSKRNIESYFIQLPNANHIVLYRFALRVLLYSDSTGWAFAV